MSTEIQGIQFDDETRAALLLFNERVEASAAEERAAKRIKKAERAKDEAAAVVRKVNDNPQASAEEKAEAEEKYKAAVENYQVIRADPDAGLPEKKPKATPAAEADAPADTEDPAAEAAEADAPAEPDVAEAPLTEVSADEEAAAAPAASSGEGE